MKLKIMITIYTLWTLMSLALLYGPLKRAVNPDRRHPARVWVPVLILLALFSLSLTGALLPSGPLCWFFQKWGNIFTGYALYFFTLLLLAWLMLLPKRVSYKKHHKKKWVPARGVSAAFLILALVLSVALNIYGWKVSHTVTVSAVSIDRSVLGQSQPGKIILIGDLHIGVNSSADLYRDMVERINEQDPDLILVAGDIFTSSYGAMRDPDAYSGVLSQMKAKNGVYVVYGNHDVDEPLLGGFTCICAENAKRNPEVPEFLEKCGWKLLADQSVQLRDFGGLRLIGRRDKTRPGDGVSERASLAELTDGIDSSEHVLLIQHEPSELQELEKYGIDLSVSGHTHDGQMFPGNIFCRIKGPQSYGLKEWGDSLALVTSGVGYYGPPIRIGTVSEIMVVYLK